MKRAAGVGVLILGGGVLLITALKIGPVRADLPPDLTKDEGKCQSKTVQSLFNYVPAVGKCVMKCEKGTPGDPACDPDLATGLFGGATGACQRAAAQKAISATVKGCAKDCPECYGGDCSAAAFSLMQTDLQIAALAPILYCDATNGRKCQDTTVKTLGKYAPKRETCYSKCRKAQYKGKIQSGCTPPATDAATVACLNKKESKAVAAIDKKCTGADKPACYGANTGATWTMVVDAAVDAVSGEDGNWCASPSGAFLG